jgi:hypothetical protein
VGTARTDAAQATSNKLAEATSNTRAAAPPGNAKRDMISLQFVLATRHRAFVALEL